MGKEVDGGLKRFIRNASLLLLALPLSSCHSSADSSGISSGNKLGSASGSLKTAAVVSDATNVFNPFILSVGQSVQTGNLTLIFQADGNLVLYQNFTQSGQAALWSSGTQIPSCGAQCQAIFQTDGNFVIYQNGKALWSTGTQATAPELLLTATPPYVSIWNRGIAPAPVQVSTTGNFSPFVLETNEYVKTGDLTLFMQTDGNLVLYQNFGTSDATALWSSGTNVPSCTIGCVANFQADGNLVLYQNGAAYWSTGTQLSPPNLQIQPVAPYVSVGPALSDLQIIQNSIDEAIDTGGPATVTLQPRVYNLNCVNLPQNYCLTIYGSNSLTIQGIPGQTKLLINAPRAGAIHVSGAVNLTLSGFEIDYLTPPFSQGVISNVTATYFDYTVTTNYLYPNDPLFIDDMFGVPGSERLGFIFSPNSTTLKNIPTSSRGTVSLAQVPQSVGDNLWRMYTNEQNISGYIASGDSFVLVPRTSYGLFFQSCSNLTLNQIKLDTAPFIGTLLGGCTGTVTFNQYNVGIPAGSGRLISTVADGIHAQDNSAVITIKNSQIANDGDDLINIYATPRTVYAVQGSKLQLLKPANDLLEYAVGDSIQVTDPYETVARLGPGGEATITSVGVDSTYVYLTLNKNIQVLPNGSPATRANDLVFDVQQASPGSVLSGNGFGTARGLIRLRSANAAMLDNSFSDPVNAKVLFSTDYPWLEGPMVSPPQSADNTVIGGLLEFFGVGMSLIN